ncbi:MAG: diguanylate cyclase domain-containing protein, partial [Casimicrobium sp.]
PFTIENPAAFHATGVAEQMLQGVLLGIALCLIFYSGSQYLSSRERLFLKYGLLVFGSTLFMLVQLGVGAQYVWRNNFWIESHAAGLAALAAIGGTFLFLEEALRETPIQQKTQSPLFARIMKGGALLTLVLAVLFVSDVFDLAAMTTLVTLLGPMPSLIAAPKILQRVRNKDAIGWYLLIAFTMYGVAVVTITWVIRGKLPVNFWTLHAFQFGAVADMLAFMYVLTLRTKAIRMAVLHASHERDIMRALAHSDPLTGLANRRSLSDALASAIARCTPTNLLAVYVIDLDNFKPVNDSYGHDVGDELLIAVAKRIQASVRMGDVVSRMGGDEFVILASGLRNEQQAGHVGEALLNAFDAPIALAKHSVKVNLTVGYAIAPIDGKDSVTILKLADDAMYAGKQSGKGSLRRTAK